MGYVNNYDKNLEEKKSKAAVNAGSGELIRQDSVMIHFLFLPYRNSPVSSFTLHGRILLEHNSVRNTSFFFLFGDFPRTSPPTPLRKHRVIIIKSLISLLNSIELFKKQTKKLSSQYTSELWAFIHLGASGSTLHVEFI